MFIKAFAIFSCGMYGFSYIFPKVFRYIVKYEDKNCKEYEEKRNRQWLEDTKDKPVIPNSKGENFF